MGIIIALINLIRLPFMIIDWVLGIAHSNKIDKEYREANRKRREDEERKD